MFKDSRISLAWITDGTSNTVMVAERPPLIMGANWAWGWWDSYDEGDLGIGLKNSYGPLGYTSWCSGAPPAYFGPGPHSADLNTYIGGGPNPNCHANHPWSFHPGGANMLLADGSVRFVSYHVGAYLPALATRSGGESVDQYQF